MGELVELDAQRPHQTGVVECWGCGHEWVAVAPVGVTDLECPRCHFHDGRWKDAALPTDPETKA